MPHCSGVSQYLCRCGERYQAPRPRGGPTHLSPPSSGEARPVRRPYSRTLASHLSLPGLGYIGRISGVGVRSPLVQFLFCLLRLNLPQSLVFGTTLVAIEEIGQGYGLRVVAWWVAAQIMLVSTDARAAAGTTGAAVESVPAANPFRPERNAAGAANPHLVYFC